MGLHVRGLFTDGMRTSGIDNRGMSNAMLDNGPVNIRLLESKLRGIAGCSRKMAKTLVARVKILEGLDDVENCDDSGFSTLFNRDDCESESDAGDSFSDLMERYDKLKIQ